MLDINIRNQIAFRKVIRIANKCLYVKHKTHTWSIHIDGLLPNEFDTEKAKVVITKMLFSQKNLLNIINELHKKSEETVLEHRNITLDFLEMCQKET